QFVETERPSMSGLALAVRLLQSAGDAEGALRAARGLRPSPDAHVAFVLGLVASLRGNEARARMQWETAVAEGGPAATDAAIHLGALLLQSNDTEGAIEVLEWAFLLHPGNTAIASLLGKA